MNTSNMLMSHERGHSTHHVFVKLPIRIKQICGGLGAISNDNGTAKGSDPEQSAAESATSCRATKRKTVVFWRKQQKGSQDIFGRKSLIRQVRPNFFDGPPASGLRTFLAPTESVKVGDGRCLMINFHSPFIKLSATLCTEQGTRLRISIS